MRRRRPRRALDLAGSTLVLLACGCGSPPEGHEPAGLQAALWSATAAEHDALCVQLFRQATETVRARTTGRSDRYRRDDVGLLRNRESGERLAAIFDLDETVLDNTDFQFSIIAEGIPYSPERWGRWVVERSQHVRLLPGVRQCLRELTGAGITPVFISNRREKRRAETLALLRDLGWDAPDLDGRVLLRAGSSDKSPRRRAVHDLGYEVVAVFGDDLLDFPGSEALPRDATPEQRRAWAEEYRDNWGRTWFVLPNPMYGSWSRALETRDPRVYLDRAPRRGAAPH